MNQTLGQTATPDSDAGTPKLFARLFLIFECERPAARSMSLSLAGISELAIGRGTARSYDQGGHRLSLADKWLSSNHARLQDSFGRWILHDLDSKNGCKVNGESIARKELRDGDVLELGRSFFMFREAADEGRDAVLDFERSSQSELPITLNPQLRHEVDKLTKLAATSISILILGESGSGKEVLAQHVHAASARPGQFVPVNCGALPSGLVESELFGHKKGAFSGAVDEHKGLVRGADAGTLFLDEIADLPAAAQATMLRVLQDKEVRPVGGTQSLRVDLRTVAATHLDLDARVESGDFRRDLYARIANYRMSLPPLRERREDLGLLLACFLAEEESAEFRLSIEAGRALIDYDWPLNIRELRSCLATARVLTSEGCIDLEHLPEALREPRQAGAARGASAAPGNEQDSERREQLLQLLTEHQGNVSAVARAMNKDRKQIQRWIKRFEIELDRFRQR